MVFVEFHAEPPADEREGDVGGAYVACWIDVEDLDEAVARAHANIVGSGWKPTELRDALLVARDDYEPDDPHLAYFDQAILDREVLVFHCYPVDDADPE